jgi:hypothetical protein
MPPVKLPCIGAHISRKCEKISAHDRILSSAELVLSLPKGQVERVSKDAINIVQAGNKREKDL